MAARLNFRLALLFLLLSGAVGDSTRNASNVSDTPSTSARITNSLNIKLTSLIIPTRQTITTSTSTLVSPILTTYPSDQLQTSGVIYVITTDVLPAMSSLMTTIVPRGSKVIVSSASAAVTILSTLIQPTTTNGHPLPSSVFTMPVLSTSPSLPGASSSMLPMPSSSIVVFMPTMATNSMSSSVIPATTSPATTAGKNKAEENRKLLLYIAPPAGLVVLVCILIGTILCIRRYRRIRKWRLQLMPLHNLDNADSDEEELLNDDEAPTFQVSSDEARQPILSFD